MDKIANCNFQLINFDIRKLNHAFLVTEKNVHPWFTCAHLRDQVQIQGGEDTEKGIENFQGGSLQIIESDSPCKQTYTEPNSHFFYI